MNSSTLNCSAVLSPSEYVDLLQLGWHKSDETQKSEVYRFRGPWIGEIMISKDIKRITWVEGHYTIIKLAMRVLENYE